MKLSFIKILKASLTFNFMQAQAILTEARQLFAGGELSDDDKLAFLTEMQQLFLDSKQRARKFTPRKYLRENDGE